MTTSSAGTDNDAAKVKALQVRDHYLTLVALL